MVSAILLAGGQGARMRHATPKQYLPLKGLPLILYSFRTLQKNPEIQEIVVVCESHWQEIFLQEPSKKPVRFALPGKERQDSVRHGFQALSSDCHFACIHDGARPLLSTEELSSVICAGKSHGAATLAVPVKMTIKESTEALFVKKTLPRSSLWEIQTPQVLSYPLLKEGLERAAQEKWAVTDDVSLAELLGYPVKLVPGSYENIKITTPEDLALAEILLKDKLCQNTECSLLTTDRALEDGKSNPTPSPSKD